MESSRSRMHAAFGTDKEITDIMFRLAHLSDPHLGPLPPVTISDLMSKRIFGYLNWYLHRSRTVLQANVIDAIVADIKATGPDHVAVTGDLVNLALKAEFPSAATWLTQFGAPQDVSVVPGNHDAYVPGAVARARCIWADHMRGDADGQAQFPYVRRRGSIALIGVSTAKATAPLMATGHIDRHELAALEAVLNETGREGLCRVVMIHHPPVPGITKDYKRLVETPEIRAALARAGAELVLHGHTHKASLNWTEGPNGAIPIVGTQAASLQASPEKRGAGWNLFEIDGEAGHWSIRMTERGFAIGGSAIETLSSQILQPA